MYEKWRIKKRREENRIRSKCMNGRKQLKEKGMGIKTSGEDGKKRRDKQVNTGEGQLEGMGDNRVKERTGRTKGRNCTKTTSWRRVRKKTWSLINLT